jgi:quercetin dioxygenase-like cupin family protein
MNIKQISDSQTSVPPDDTARELTAIDPDALGLKHIGIVGDTYTILISGADTDGRYCLIDMMVSPNGGPGPHRHNFEEMFHIMEGELEITFRGEKHVVTAGMSINVPANAPHSFKNASDQNVRMLCMCSPSGQEEFFLDIGLPVQSRTAAAPTLNEAQKASFIQKAGHLAAQYQTELLKP